MGGCASRPTDLKEERDAPMSVEGSMKSIHQKSDEEEEMVEVAADGTQSLGLLLREPSLGLLLKEEEAKEAERPIKEKHPVDAKDNNVVAVIHATEDTPQPVAPKSETQIEEPIKVISEETAISKETTDVKPQQNVTIAVAA